MSADWGKKFEARFKLDWQKSFPRKFLIRLHDQVTRYKKVSKNPSDFIGFLANYAWLLECKETSSSTLNFSKVSQLDTMLEMVTNYDNLVGYVIVWFRMFDRVIAVSADSMDQMRQDGLKSVNINKFSLLAEKYHWIEIPSIKKQKYLESDYRILLEEVQDEH